MWSSAPAAILIAVCSITLAKSESAGKSDLGAAIRNRRSDLLRSGRITTQASPRANPRPRGAAARRNSGTTFCASTDPASACCTRPSSQLDPQSECATLLSLEMCSSPDALVNEFVQGLCPHLCGHCELEPEGDDGDASLPLCTAPDFPDVCCIGSSCTSETLTTANCTSENLAEAVVTTALCPAMCGICRTEPAPAPSAAPTVAPSPSADMSCRNNWDCDTMAMPVFADPSDPSSNKCYCDKKCVDHGDCCDDADTDGWPSCPDGSGSSGSGSTPTSVPTAAPTSAPTVSPTSTPTAAPTAAPTHITQTVVY